MRDETLHSQPETDRQELWRQRDRLKRDVGSNSLGNLLLRAAEGGEAASSDRSEKKKKKKKPDRGKSHGARVSWSTRKETQNKKIRVVDGKGERPRLTQVRVGLSVSKKEGWTGQTGGSDGPGTYTRPQLVVVVARGPRWTHAPKAREARSGRNAKAEMALLCGLFGLCLFAFFALLLG